MKKFRNSVATILAFLMIFGCFSFTAQAEDQVTMYAWDGTSYMINQSEVAAYKAVGLYENLWEVQTKLYSPSGSSVVVFNSEINDYLNQGWYTVPVVYMYAQDGTEYVIATNEVQAYKQAGLSETKPEATVTVYSPNGGALNLSASEAAAYLAVGWAYTNPDTYFASDVPNYSKITNAWLKNAYDVDGGIIHVYDYNYQDFQTYVNYLVNNGWIFQGQYDGIYNYTKGNALSAFYIENNELKLVYLYAYAYELYYPGLKIPDYSVIAETECLGCQTIDDFTAHPHRFDKADVTLYISVITLDGWNLIASETVDVGVEVGVFEKDGMRFMLHMDQQLNLVTIFIPN